MGAEIYLLPFNTSLMNFRILVFVILPLLGIGQKNIKGVVYDFKTDKPIPFATVYIKHSTIGVICDDAGLFDIRSTSGDTLVISNIGYESLKFSFKGLKPDSNYRFKLKPTAIILDEALVLALSPKELLSQTIQNLNKNYLTVISQQNAGLKQYSKVDDVFLRNIHANISIFNPSYSKKKRQEVKVTLCSGTVTTNPNPLFDSIGFLYLYNVFDEISIGTRLKQLYSLIDKFEVAKITGKTNIGDYIAYKLIFEQSTITGDGKKTTRIEMFIEEESKAVITLFLSSDRGYGPDKETKIIETPDSSVTRMPAFSSASFNYRPFNGKWILTKANSRLDVKYLTRNNHTNTISHSVLQENLIEIEVNETIFNSKLKPKASECLNLYDDLFVQVKNKNNVPNR